MKKRMQELYKMLEKYNYHYHTLDESLISDYEYDKLLQELISYEEKYPQFKKENSITDKVGDIKIDSFKKVEHKTPMLSLSNAFSFEDLVEFDQKVKKVSENYSYVCELKIDGIAISLVYENGTLKHGVTRGDGQVGEDVTHNVKTIKSIPTSIPVDLEVRGEIYISKENFLKIQKKEKQVYANPRNLAAGTIRQLDNKVARQRELSIFVYGLANYESFGHKTYFESMKYLKGLGFQINEKLKVCKTIKDVYNYILEITDIRENLEYEIDGIVIKVNEYDVQRKLGFTSKFPKSSIAYKFKSDFATTKLLDIIYTVGRTGKVIPNAVLEPVFLMGSKIQRATLHNEDYILEKNIEIGDEVKIIKAGDIIPRVQEVVKKNKKSIPFEFPKKCPACNTTLVKEEKDYICYNKECPGKNVEKIIYFISPAGFDIKGLGDKVVKKLYEKNIIGEYIDIFDLTYEKLYQLEGFQEKSINNLLNSIENSKQIELSNFISSLGIKNLGIETAKEIARKYETMNDVKNLSVEELEDIEGIGSIIAQSVYDFFQNHNNLEKIDYLISKGIVIKNSLFNQKEVDSKLSGKTIVITGKFSNLNRNDLKKNIEAQGGKVSSAVSKNTDLLFCGKDAGSKKQKAQELNIPIILEDQISEYIN